MECSQYSSAASGRPKRTYQSPGNSNSTSPKRCMTARCGANHIHGATINALLCLLDSRTLELFQSCYGFDCFMSQFVTAVSNISSIPTYPQELVKKWPQPLSPELATRDSQVARVHLKDRNPTSYYACHVYPSIQRSELRSHHVFLHPTRSCSAVNQRRLQSM